MIDYEDMLDTAVDIAERAGQVALSYFRQAILIEMKANHTPVTMADKKTEEMIRGELAKEFPNHGLLGEEFENHATDAEFVWTIDPIDGTRSFIRGIPLWGTLVGLLHRGEPVLGVMVLPALDETYSAAKGCGTFCDGVQLHVSATQSLEAAIVSCGDTNCFESVGRRPLLDAVQNKAELCRGYTDCFGHALMVRGAVDAMIDPLVSIWDIAPIACIVKEAGGEYFAFNGAETIQETSFITCTPALKKQLLSLP